MNNSEIDLNLSDIIDMCAQDISYSMNNNTSTCLLYSETR